MFKLLFNESIRWPIPEEWRGDNAWATVTIGDFEENFPIPLHHWQKCDYIRQWREACHHLLSENSPAAFLVDVKAPWHLMRFSFAWVAYADTDAVHIQNVMLKPYRFRRGDLLNPHCAVPPRETVSSDPHLGDSRISEWDTCLKDIEVYAGLLQRLKS